MKRLLANTLMLIGGLTVSSQLLALGLGELDLKSALNQPLQAEIELIDTEGLTEYEIKPTLATAADFERAGVDRVYFLTKIKFEVADGKILLSTREPVNEPFLNFLVELNWPSGRALREYTLLLDPPTFQEAAIQPLVNTPAARAQTSQPAQPQQPVQQPQSQPAVSSAANRWENEPAAPGTYKVQRDDTLWQIALQTRPDRSVTPQQMMVALQEKNPQAFIGGNINRLKTHEVLRIPDAEEVRNISFRNAVAEVDRQNKELTSGAQLDATGRAGTSAVSSGEQDGGEVRLLSASSDDSDAAGASGDAGTAVGEGRQQSLENDLAIALENVDKSRRENQELRERLEALEEQISTLQRLISLKDDQLATMQVDGQAGQVDGQAADESGTAAEDAVAPGQDESADDAGMEGADTDAESATASDDAVDFNYAGDEEDSAQAQGDTDAAAQAEAEAAAAKAKAEEEAAARRERIAKLMAEQEAQRTQPSFLETLLANPLVPAGGGLVLLLIALLIYRAIKGRKKPAEDDASELPEDDMLSFSDGEIDADSLDDFHFEEDPMGGESADLADDDLDTTVVLPQDDSNEEFETVAQTEDVISESDIYIAYGKFEQAIELLQGAIENEPSRTDVRLKLLEVYVEMDEAAGFADAESELRKLGDREASAQAEQMRSRLSAPIALGAAASQADDALSLDGDIPSLDESAGDDFSDGLDFGDALDLSGDLGEPVLADDNASDEFDLDTDLDDTGAGLEEVPTLDLDDGLEFDLSDDQSAEDDQAEVPEITDVADDDSGLEFDLSELAADDTPAEETAGELSFDEPESSEDNSLEFDLSGLDSGDSEDDEPVAEAADDSVSSLDFDLATNEAADDKDDLSDLESLLDSDSEGSDELPDLAFDSSADADSEDDLASLESELDSLASEPADQQDSDEGMDFSADLADLDSELSGLEDADAETSEVPQLDDVAGDDAGTDSASESSSGEIDLDELAAADDEFDFLAGTDECATKLDLARAYIDMEDFDGAKELLQEVVQEGSDQQKSDARSMMDSLS